MFTFMDDLFFLIRGCFLVKDCIHMKDIIGIPGLHYALCHFTICKFCSCVHDLGCRIGVILAIGKGSGLYTCIVQPFSVRTGLFEFDSPAQDAVKHILCHGAVLLLRSRHRRIFCLRLRFGLCSCIRCDGLCLIGRGGLVRLFCLNGSRLRFGHDSICLSLCGLCLSLCLNSRRILDIGNARLSGLIIGNIGIDTFADLFIHLRLDGVQSQGTLDGLLRSLHGIKGFLVIVSQELGGNFRDLGLLFIRELYTIVCCMLFGKEKFLQRSSEFRLERRLICFSGA